MRSRSLGNEVRPNSRAPEIVEAALTVDFDERLTIGSGSAAAKRRGVGSARGPVLILPPFGIPAAALGFVADLVVAEGYEAILLDTRDNNGSGSGEIYNFLLSTVIEDCRAAVEHYRPEVVVAVSLSARAAARALAELPDAPRAVFLLPVVDVRSTLVPVLGRDYFQVPLAPIPVDEHVLGFEVSSEAFRTDCLDLEILSAESMRQDLAAIGAPVTLLPATKDPWIDHSTVTDVFHSVASQDPSLRMRSLACDQHELHKDPALALRLIGEVVAEACAPAHQRTA